MENWNWVSGALSYSISWRGSEKFEFRIHILFLTARTSSLSLKPSLSSSSRMVTHDIPVGVIPRRLWNDFREPSVPDFDVSLCFYTLYGKGRLQVEYYSCWVYYRWVLERRLKERGEGWRLERDGTWLTSWQEGPEPVKLEQVVASCCCDLPQSGGREEQRTWMALGRST